MEIVTGDTHGLCGYPRLKKFAEKNPFLTKADFLIIAGDCGVIWDRDSLKKKLDLYSSLPWTTLFVDGNHENFDLMNAYPVEMWNGGKIHKIREDIIHLMRGQVFEIEGKTIFTFGGATSIDRHNRIEGISWWPQELPTYEDLDEADRNLNHYGRKVDYIITHSCGKKMLWAVPLQEQSKKKKECYDNALLHKFEEDVQYKHWYFGHYHVDKRLNDKHTSIYVEFIELK